MSATKVVLSAVIVAKDAAKTLDKALLSVQFCDEIIVVVDANSSDNTEEIAKKLASSVVVHPWEGFGLTKRFAVSLARGDWIVSIDSDEIMSPELANAIRTKINNRNESYLAYAFRRRTRFLGNWICHGDWGHDRVVRLFRRNMVNFSADVIHEMVLALGHKPILHGLLLHEGDATLESYLDRQNRYSTLAAEAMLKEGRHISWVSLAVVPFLRFIRSYFLRLGFLDGWRGFVLAWYSSVYVFNKYAKLICLWNAKNR